MDVDAIFRTLGRFSVRFRWSMLLAWIIAAAAAASFLPSLSSVTQSDNTKFLPASAPVEKATMLAAPFGTANLLPIPLVAARPTGPLTAADFTALAALQSKLKSDPSVVRTIDLGQSPARQTAGQANEFVVLVHQLGGDPNAATNLIDGLRARISQTPLPAGLQAHLAGAFAVQVDQQKANGNQGGQIELYSSLLIIVLLVLIFRSLTLALVTLAPALLSVIISGPLVAEAAQHGLKVSPIAQFLMIVLVLGAGTDYGLFLVFRVREQLRIARHDGGPGPSVWADLRGPREPARQAIITSITKVGESITFSAATVIAAVLTLLLASFPFYADLGVPFAIAIGVTLLAALTLLPALLSIRLSLLGVKRTLFQQDVRQAEAAALGHPGRRQARPVGHDRGPDRQVPASDAARRPGLLRRPGHRGDRLQGSWLRRQHHRAGRHRLGRRPGPADQVLPAVDGEPDQPDLQVQPSRYGTTRPCWPRAPPNSRPARSSHR